MVIKDPTDPTNPMSVYVGNKINFTALVTGVPLGNIQVRQTYVSGTATDPVTGQLVQFKGPGDLDAVTFSEGSFQSGNVQHASAFDSNGVQYLPSATVLSNGAVVLTFYDGPGQAGNPGDLSRPSTTNQTITTAIVDTRTGTVLTQYTWTTSSTFNPNGTGTTTYGPSFGPTP